MSELLRGFGFTRRDAQMWGAYALGVVLGWAPGENYRALRFLGDVLVYGVATLWLVGFCRWCKAQGFKQTLLNLSTMVPPLLLVWFWLAGPGHWLLRVVVGFVLYVLAAMASGVVKQAIRERREQRP